jgi:hypothetical protein
MTRAEPLPPAFTAAEWAAFGREDRRAAIAIFAIAVAVFLLGIAIYTIVFIACV